MNKLIVDVTLSLFDRSGYRRWEAEEVASFVLKAKRKEYGGMFEAVIESMIEGREEAWAEGHAEGHAEGWKGGREEVARNALAEGASIEFVTKVTGLDMETVKRLASE
ncbi:MAG: hypothetical protein FWH19_00720 [Treponema sp.]|nr:hypothetical protein [Treponema sp.]